MFIDHSVDPYMGRSPSIGSQYCIVDDLDMEIQLTGENNEIGTCVMREKGKVEYYFNCKEGSNKQNCRTTDIQEHLWRLKLNIYK
jgi:hypothetical protein